MGAVRLFLALVVAVDHFNGAAAKYGGPRYPDYLKIGMFGPIAVMFFYVISGFLISTVLTDKYKPGAEGSLQFYSSRFLRIFSLYWPMVLVCFAVFPPSLPAFWANGIADKLSDLFLFGIDWRLAFGAYPQAHFAGAIQGIEQSWTLGAELTFYAVAPFLIRSRVWFWIILILSCMTRAALVHYVGSNFVWTYVFAPGTFMFFLFGHIARSAAARWGWMKDWRLCVVLLGLCIGLLNVGGPIQYDTWRFWAASLGFAAAVPSIFHYTGKSPWLNVLGELSYPVYLVHLLIIHLLINHSILRLLPTSQLGITVAFLSLIVGGAAVAHWTLERPFALLLRAVLLRVASKFGNRRAEWLTIEVRKQTPFGAASS